MFIEIIINRRDADLTVTQFDTIREAVKDFVGESVDVAHRGAMLTRDTAYMEQVESAVNLGDLAEQLRECLPVHLEPIYSWSFCHADDSASGIPFICLELDD